MTLRVSFALSLVACTTLSPHTALAFSPSSSIPTSRPLTISQRGMPLAPGAAHGLPLGLRRRGGSMGPKAHMEFAQPMMDAVQLLAAAAADVESAAPSGPASFVPSYSVGSYYATLGLFLLSIPGAWSLVTRSVKYKPIKKTYVTDGPAKGKEVRQTAAEITAYFRALNFSPEPTSDTVTFRGTMGKSQSQALYLTFCTFLSLAAVGIVLTITNPLVSEKEFSPWYYLTLLSPAAGAYYWTNAQQDVSVQIKMEESEDGSECDVTALGTKEELERFCETMGFTEKGMVRVPGIMETLSEGIK
eukprot:CAMPEP_0114135898 /NCGR_PEP_ID=MMETSP0043_2-20121206/14929_1 /TAXON_ID=464988 /ORGANISM="Hemiselmis andersenii, Strain CCMP644" /LENGTH=301 /DNA_ID=CAMNT_0001229621 /DNA_START=26 /DNA_END=931 /DNA_ORIENTATION=-